jgi:hypothetical protein
MEEYYSKREELDGCSCVGNHGGDELKYRWVVYLQNIRTLMLKSVTNQDECVWNGWNVCTLRMSAYVYI